MNNRYDFCYIFDITNGNPNGDPDNGNSPRVDPITNHGLITDVCLKRKIRNYIWLAKEGERENGFDIYVRERAVLEHQQVLAYNRSNIEPTSKPSIDQLEQVRSTMCERFYDIRAFGAVMSTKAANCGQVRGPVQIGFASSVDPVLVQEHTITRCAVGTETQSEKQAGLNQNMGNKFTIPYGLYVAHGHINPFLATQTGFTDYDLEILWKALMNMFEIDYSASRGEMVARRLYVFKHNDKLGSMASHKLFDKIRITAIKEQPRKYADYKIDFSGLSGTSVTLSLLE